MSGRVHGLRPRITSALGRATPNGRSWLGTVLTCSAEARGPQKPAGIRRQRDAACACGGGVGSHFLAEVFLKGTLASGVMDDDNSPRVYVRWQGGILAGAIWYIVHETGRPGWYVRAGEASLSGLWVG